jgi:hypothetical protein
MEFISDKVRVTSFDARKYRPANLHKAMSPDLLNMYQNIVHAKYDRGPQIIIEKDPDFEHRGYRKIMKNWVHLTDPDEGILLDIM